MRLWKWVFVASLMVPAIEVIRMGTIDGLGLIPLVPLMILEEARISRREGARHER